jgi:hypothetical protein
MHSQALHIDEKESSKENHYFLKAAVQQLQAADRSSTINLPSILYLCKQCLSKRMPGQL